MWLVQIDMTPYKEFYRIDKSGLAIQEADLGGFQQGVGWISHNGVR